MNRKRLQTHPKGTGWADFSCWKLPGQCVIVLHTRMKSHRHDSKPLVRLVHFLLLIGWMLSSHGIAPAVCMAAAMIDGDHAVKVGVSNKGALTVVLSHAGKSAAELTVHEHDALCRVLVAFAEAPASNAADHVLAFKQVDDASRAQRLMTSTQGIAKAAVVAHVVVHTSITKPAVIAVVGRLPQSSWSQGLALKSGRTVMRC